MRLKTSLYGKHVVSNQTHHRGGAKVQCMCICAFYAATVTTSTYLHVHVYLHVYTVLNAKRVDFHKLYSLAHFLAIYYMYMQCTQTTYQKGSSLYGDQSDHSDIMSCDHHVT